MKEWEKRLRDNKKLDDGTRNSFIDLIKKMEEKKEAKKNQEMRIVPDSAIDHDKVFYDQMLYDKAGRAYDLARERDYERENADYFYELRNS